MSANHQSCLLKQLDQQRRQDLFCDCNVLVEGHLFRAHRNVLFGSSGYFRMLLSQGARDYLEPVSASFDAFSPDIFTVILDFVYSGQLELNSTNVIEVMSAASYLQMDEVIAYCKSFIKSSLEISTKEDDSRYLCLSDGSPPRDSGEEASKESTTCEVGTAAQNILWDHQEETQPKYEYPGEVTSPQVPALPQSPTTEPDLEPGMEEDRTALFTAGVSESRRRGKRKRTATHRYAQDDSSPIDLQRAAEAAHAAQKADDLYASMPTIVGVVGVFNKGEIKRHLFLHTLVF